MQDEKRKGDDEEPVPGIEEAEGSVGAYRSPAEGYEDSLIYLGALLAEPDRDGHAIGGVGLHIADVVDIQYTHAEKTDRCGGQQQIPGMNRVRRHEVGAHYRDDSEEDEDEHVAEPPVAVRIAAEGVFHRAEDGRGAEEHQANGLQREQRPERNPDHRKAAQDAHPDENADENLHIPHRQFTAVQPVLRTDPLGRIRPVKDVAEFVGKIGKNLQADRRQHNEHGRPHAHLIISRSKQNTQHHPRE